MLHQGINRRRKQPVISNNIACYQFLFDLLSSPSIYCTMSSSGMQLSLTELASILRILKNDLIEAFSDHPANSQDVGTVRVYAWTFMQSLVSLLAKLTNVSF